MEASSPDLWSSECRFVVVWECGEEEWREGEEERRRENMVRERVGEVVVVGGGECLFEEKRPEVRDWTGAGGGEGSRREKRGMVAVGVLWRDELCVVVCMV